MTSTVNRGLILDVRSPQYHRNEPSQFASALEFCHVSRLEEKPNCIWWGRFSFLKHGTLHRRPVHSLLFFAFSFCTTSPSPRYLLANPTPSERVESGHMCRAHSDGDMKTVSYPEAYIIGNGM